MLSGEEYRVPDTHSFRKMRSAVAFHSVLRRRRLPPTSSTALTAHRSRSSSAVTADRYGSKYTHNIFSNDQVCTPRERLYSTSSLVSDAAAAAAGSNTTTTSSSSEGGSSVSDSNEPSAAIAETESNNSSPSGDAETETETDSTNNLEDDLEELLSSEQYDPQTAVDDIFMASRWNQGLGPSGEWNPTFVRESLDKYERYLRYVLHRLNSTVPPDGAKSIPSSSAQSSGHKNNEENESNDNEDDDDEEFRSIAERIDPDATKLQATRWLLSSNTVSRAFRAITRSKMDTYDMGRRVRALEKLVGSIGLTPLTDLLSQNLLEANGKAGNVGRSLSLLALRQSRRYPPTQYEFRHAIQSIESAGLYMRKSRNVFLGEKGQPPLDNPTRWLDQMLLNMSSRGVQLDTETANQMLDCYASMGRTGKAVHFHYDVIRDFVEEDGTYYGPMRDVGGGFGTAESQPQHYEGKKIPDHVLKGMPTFYDRKIKVRMRMRDPPPFHKVPSRVKGTLVRREGSDETKVTKLEQESEKAWSPSLTAAFAFADSLTHGACGHSAIELDKKSWNILIAACCNRGALWRALQILEETMPNNGFEADIFTYNTILAALSRVGDMQSMREMMVKMTNAGIKPHSYTVDFLVSGHLNSGDIGGAVTIVQDMFNQHSVLPPYTTHLKIIEFALANDLVYEAKRHVYFLQQIWKWKPNDSIDPKFRKLMHLTKNNPSLSRKALKKLFRYFGEDLTDEDFF